MSESPSNSLTIAEAVNFLKRYGCDRDRQNNSSADYPLLRQALLLIIKESEWENLGVCADNPNQGLAAVKSYLAAIGYQDNFVAEIPEDLLDEPVYIKFNTQKMSCYLDSYTGDYRGVLVAIQGEDERVLGTYGHFPLDLFED
ncbi:protein of unknown function (DUF1824) [Xenococcus sp. PCC 7305]|uniref:DUF1824 family protein n=1 Tax=Xenococcus sp. PCC 7305 TaxID=102125 RepID=UPI0002AD0E0A|nr:DUF1824 family protein [Xenococcus sp. PCC 7305]ELS00461.1 protein of unknown function (DUF1824) [Xenococcus sp. PCC 7305]